MECLSGQELISNPSYLKRDPVNDTLFSSYMTFCGSKYMNREKVMITTEIDYFVHFLSGHGSENIIRHSFHITRGTILNRMHPGKLISAH